MNRRDAIYSSLPFGRYKIRTLALCILFLSPLLLKSQDLIILRNGEQIECKITKVDNTSVFYDFYKGGRKLSSFTALDEVKKYQINHREVSMDGTEDTLQIYSAETVVVDTSKYVKETQKWVNLLTYSQRFGVNAQGWSVQYYGYNFVSTAKWFVPIVFGFESFDLDPGYFSRSGYNYLDISYLGAGISPFYKINDLLFLNLGVQLLYGEEELQDARGSVDSRSIFGITPSQGIYFIPKSGVGIMVGVSVYEKLLSSKVYKSDLGLKFELGIKF